MPADDENVESVDELETDVALPNEDGDDSIPPDQRPTDPAPRLAVAVPARPATIVAPFRRDLKLGSAGSDVVAVKRALHRLNGYYMPKGHPITPVYGPFLKRQMRAWQHRHGLLGGDGSYGRRTHQAFVRRAAFDAYGAYLLKHADWTTPEEKRRDAVVRAALYGRAHEPEIHYSMRAALRMWGVDHRIKPPSIPLYEDCSSFATWCYWLADQDVGGVPDPNGLGYDGDGFTGTQIAHGARISTPQLGDLTFYGTGSIPSHVTVYIGDGKCVSHGSESGPKVLPVNYRGDRQQTRSYL